MDGFKLIPSDPIPPQGATKFPPPSPAIAKQDKMEAVSTEEVLGEAMEALSEGPEGGDANANGGRKRKNSRKEHFGPKKRKLNLHNCITRTVEASPRTPVRILMELGQQQKFHINYQFADPPPRPNLNKSESGASDDNGKEEMKSSDENMEAGGDEIKKEPAENGVNSELEQNNGIKKEKEDEEKGDNGTPEGEKDKDNIGEDDSKRRRPWDGEERPFWKRQFSCTLNARGFTYEGKGRTKQDAKNAAAEEAIKAMALEAPSAARAPWAAMACLGLFKVFMQWEAQGASLDHLVGGAKLNPGPPPAAPESAPMKIETIITTTNMGVPKPLIHPEPLIRDPKRERRQKKDGPKVAGRMPSNPTSRHPVQLLNELHPGLDFSFFSGGENNYDCKVTVEELTFASKGRKNKKEAKKGVAMEALSTLYNVVYPPGSQFASS